MVIKSHQRAFGNFGEWRYARQPSLSRGEFVCLWRKNNADYEGTYAPELLEKVPDYGDI